MLEVESMMRFFGSLYRLARRDADPAVAQRTSVASSARDRIVLGDRFSWEMGPRTAVTQLMAFMQLAQYNLNLKLTELRAFSARYEEYLTAPAHQASSGGTAGLACAASRLFG